jgi:hypothetical protein
MIIVVAWQSVTVLALQDGGNRMFENDWTISDWARRAAPGVLVELFGEIDVRYRRLIEDT